MSLKDFLEAAKIEDAAYKRQQEIADLDLNPEEYMLLREDKSPLGLELMEAILEAKKNAEWIVDYSTHRLMRRSTLNGDENKRVSLVNRLNGSTGGQFSVGLTSNSRRFFVKVYRDYLELSEFDLINCKFLSEAISVIDEKILEITSRREQEKVQAIEREKIAIIAESNLIQELLDQVNQADNLAFFKGEEIIKNVTDNIMKFCSALPISETIIDELDFNGQELYEIVDDVPCKNTHDLSGRVIRSISSSYIEKCIIFENLIRTDPGIFSYSDITRTFDIDGLNRRQHGALYDFMFKERRYIEQPTSDAIRLLREKISKIILEMKSPQFLISIWGIEFDGASEENMISALKMKISEMSENVRVLQWKIGQK